MANKKNIVSAIIPIYNSEKYIKECINSLLNQSRKFDEIILIDDGSTDNTVEIVKKLPIKLIALKKNIGRSAARNYGFKKSHGNIVFFVESDAKYAPDFLEKCLIHFNNKKTAGVIGKQEVWNKNESIWTKCKQAEREANFENYKPFSIWMMRRELFENAKGFDETINFGEDVDLSQRIKKMGFELKYEPNAKWFHHEPAKLKPIIKRAWNFGKGIIKFYKKNGFPKTMLIDSLFFISLIIGFFYTPIWLIAILFIIGKLIISKNVFKFIEIKYWLHLAIFIIIPSIIFKFGRIYGWFIENFKNLP